MVVENIPGRSYIDNWSNIDLWLPTITFLEFERQICPSVSTAQRTKLVPKMANFGLIFPHSLSMSPLFSKNKISISEQGTHRKTMGKYESKICHFWDQFSSLGHIWRSNSKLFLRKKTILCIWKLKIHYSSPNKNCRKI